MKLDDLRAELELATHVTPDILRRMADVIANLSGSGPTKAIEKRIGDLSNAFLAALDRIKALEEAATKPAAPSK